ncbi:MAG TPA: MBL fold metallo-hydrolase [Solirubrobacteraceae bacterium]|jgi:hydroxyacylglutathione hydrolase|nr:MBL fold metallo-hydrolase [Solirubrobacteraceae bacterium]
MTGVDVRMFTVGPVQENAYIVMAGRERGRAVMVDPGDEPERLLAAAGALGVEIEAILITHCHFDHIGAVAPLARATGAPVYCPEIERTLLSDIVSWTPPGFGPFEGWEPEHTVAGGERLTLAGLEIEVLFTPGHSPGHVTYAIAPAGESSADTAPSGNAPAAAAMPGSHHAGAGGSAGSVGEAPALLSDHAGAGGSAGSVGEAPALLSGDVLFQGSVGRVDLPGGDWSVLERSIATLMERFPEDTVVYPGHMGVTTLGRELQGNPFLTELRSTAGAPAT